MALMFRSVLQSGGGAELIVTCDSEFAGATISCSDGTTTLNKTCPVSSPYEVTFKIPNSGDWTVSATVSGTTYSSDPISVDLDYETDLEYGFNWKRWVDTAQYLDSTDYSTLSDLLADEEAVRELCLEHACVDYLCDGATVTADLATVISDNYFAKWANNSDYALDNMIANAAIKTAMDTAGKYELGEWVITDDTTTPVTWGPKGNVPVMTSNSAPYGEAFGSSCGNNTLDYYMPFRCKKYTDVPTSSDTGYIWGNNGDVDSVSAGNTYIGYKFTNPICVKRVAIGGRSNSMWYQVKTFRLYGSNDGSTWEQIGGSYSTGIVYNTKPYAEIEIENDKYYLQYKVNPTETYNDGGSNPSNYYAFITFLQFYGRELSVSVPKMTGNTTPYGIASASAEYNPAWKAFDSDPNTFWQATSTAASGAWLEYGFLNDTMLKMIVLSGLGSREFKVQGYIDNEWTDITSNYTVGSSDKDFVYITSINQSKPCKRFRYYGVNVKNHGAYSLQFYGLDYSEKEFEQGSTKKWLYDHGVELETIEIYYASSVTRGSATKQTADIILDGTSGEFVACGSQLDLSDYDKAWIASELVALASNTSGNTHQIRVGTVDSSNNISNTAAADGTMNYPSKTCLDISSLNAIYGVSMAVYRQKCLLKELWLE